MSHFCSATGLTISTTKRDWAFAQQLHQLATQLNNILHVSQLYAWVWHFLCYAVALYSDPTFVYVAADLHHSTSKCCMYNSCSCELQKLKHKVTPSDFLHCLKNFTLYLFLWIFLWSRSDHLDPKSCLHTPYKKAQIQEIVSEEIVYKWHASLKLATISVNLGYIYNISRWEVSLNQYSSSWNLEAQAISVNWESCR